MSSEANTTRRKPIKGYNVPSRFKQAAEASGQSSRSREKSQDSTRFRGRSAERKGNFKEGAKDMKSTLRSMSVESSRLISSKKFSSTPAIQGRRELPSINASAITDASGNLCVPKGNSVLTSDRNEQTFLKNSTRCQVSKGKTSKAPGSKGSMHASQKTYSEKNLGGTLSQMELNMLYAEYLQAKLLESNALIAIQKRSKLATEKIHQLWSILQNLMLENAKAQQELNITSYIINLHKHLQKQEEVLSPALSIIPQLESQYESIAVAMNTIRHKLEIKNISLLQDADSEEEVVQLLLKMSDLIKSLNSALDSNEVVAAAGASYSFLQIGKHITDEIKKVENLLSEANDLLLDETSLKLALPNEI